MSSIWSRLGTVDATRGGGHGAALGAKTGLGPPPREASVGAALLGRLLSSATVVVDGERPAGAFLDDIEAWRRTGWPRRWPRPKPRGWDTELIFTGAALYATHLAAHYGHDPELQEALGAAADRLAVTAV